MLSRRTPLVASFLFLILTSAKTQSIASSKTAYLSSNFSISTSRMSTQPFALGNLTTTISSAGTQIRSTPSNSLEFASPQSSTSSNASSTSSNSGSGKEYSFTYPGYVAGSYLQVSYKDTITASWISVPPDHPPNLLIQCWDRNTTTTSTYLLQKPITTMTLASQVDSMTSSFQVSLVPYKDYSPCQFLLQDLNTTGLDGGVGTANSSAFVISDTNSSTAQTWGLNNLAPAVMGATGSGATVALSKLGMVSFVTFLGVVITTVIVA